MFLKTVFETICQTMPKYSFSHFFYLNNYDLGLVKANNGFKVCIKKQKYSGRKLGM